MPLNGFSFDNGIYLFYNILNKTAGKEGQDFPFRRIKTNLVSRPSGQGNRAAYLFFRLRMAIISNAAFKIIIFQSTLPSGD